MTAQDDAREREMRTLFNLTRPEEYGRADVDAVLQLKGAGVPNDLKGQAVLFELKSATRGSPTISTVRDFGLHHVEKWRDLHWLFGVYGRNRSGEQILQYCLYGSPSAMKPWFDRMSTYIAPDVALAEHVPGLITDDTLTAILGPQERFNRADAQRLMKNQFSAADYDDATDLSNEEYSRAVMLKMLQQRCAYVIRRGSTLNNPHIPAGFFKGWEHITEDHAARLRELVVEAMTHRP